MTTLEFINSCTKLGYCSKQNAEYWCKLHPKDDYTEDDCIKVYRSFDKPYGCNLMNTMSGPYGHCKTTKRYLKDNDGNR